MLFTSWQFVLLVIITFSIYYIQPIKRLQISILIIASFVFYAWHNVYLLILLITSVSINAISSHFITFKNHKKKKLIATLGVAINLSILLFFKYSPLIGVTFFTPSKSITEFLIHIPLPIGISFFTFQGISLMVDTFKQSKVGVYNMPSNFYCYTSSIFLYISFFPQLIAGPIVKAHEFLPQIRAKYLKNIKWEEAFKALVVGYFLKMVIADNLKDYTFYISFPYFLEYSGFMLVTMLFGYSIQIFADFAGYSLIAIGTSKLFGYDIIQNFNYPYISKSFSEFWKRWHISLSTFLKQYLYIPLGGNRKGKIRTYFI